MLDHFRFLRSRRNGACHGEMTSIASPACCISAAGRKGDSKDVYPDLEEFYADLGKTYRKAVKAFYDAGCRYLQSTIPCGPISARRKNCRRRASAATTPMACRKSTRA